MTIQAKTHQVAGAQGQVRLDIAMLRSVTDGRVTAPRRVAQHLDRPALGRTSPSSSLSKVLLPAPFGPRMTMNSPCVDGQADVIQDGHSPQVDVDVLQGDHRDILRSRHS